MSDKDKNEHETWDLSKEKKIVEKKANAVIQGSSAELVKKMKQNSSHFIK